jgi:hypothetical protein
MITRLDICAAVIGFAAGLVFNAFVPDISPWLGVPLVMVISGVAAYAGVRLFKAMDAGHEPSSTHFFLEVKPTCRRTVAGDWLVLLPSGKEVAISFEDYRDLRSAP